MKFIRLSDFQLVFLSVLYEILHVTFFIAGVVYFINWLGGLGVVVSCLALFLEIVSKLPVWSLVDEE